MVDRKLFEAPSNFIAGRPKAAPLLWFLGEFICGVLFFMVILIIYKYNTASQAIQPHRTVPFFLMIPLLDENSFANVHVKGIVAFKHYKNEKKQEGHEALNRSPEYTGQNFEIEVTFD